MTLFELACGFSRKEAERIMKHHEEALAELPTLNPEEHAFVEKYMGMRLTNEEAQLALRSATLEAAFEHWSSGKKAS
jgi:hypothetical protein